jgi:ABC-2 type transport system permease protein
MITARLVALREIKQRLRGRVFRVATLLILIGVAAAVVIPAKVKGKSHPEHVAVLGSSTETVVATAKHIGIAVRIVSEPNATAARADVRSGRIDLAVIDGRRIIVKKAITDDDGSDTANLASGLAQTLGLGQAVRAAGLSGTQETRLAQAKPVPISGLEAAPTHSSSRTGTAVVGLVVLFIMLTQYLTWTLIGVMEEKSSRVVEVLLAAVRPLQLLTGKVIGIGVVVFAQAALVAAFALLLGRAVGSDLLHGKAPLVLVSALIWLVLGYAFYCWLYAAAGSMAERQDQVQSLAIPLSLPLIAGYIIGITSATSDNPHLYVKVLAYLPPTAPFEMTAMVGIGAVRWWQFLLSAVISLASTVVVARLAATVYRRAILRTGKRVRLREVLA